MKKIIKVQSNLEGKIVSPLILSVNDLSVNARRILLLCSSMIENNDPVDTLYSFTFDEYSAIYGLGTAKIHSKLKEALYELKNKEILLPNELGKINSCLDYADIKNCCVQVVFNNVIFNLFKHCTEYTYPLTDISGLRSAYSYKLFELFLYKFLINRKKKIEWVVGIDWLRMWLNHEDNYKNNADFCKRVIYPAINEINNIQLIDEHGNTSSNNLYIEVTDMRDNRKITYLKFKINNKINFVIAEFNERMKCSTIKK